MQDILQTNKLKMQDKEISRSRQSCKSYCERNKSQKCKTRGINVQDQSVRKQRMKKVQDKKQDKSARLAIGFKGASQRCKSKVQDIGLYDWLTKDLRCKTYGQI